MPLSDDNWTCRFCTWVNSFLRRRCRNCFKRREFN